MTERAEPDDDDEVLAESLIATYGCAVSKPLDSRVRLGGHPGEETSRLFAEALAGRRIEIEAQAKRAQNEAWCAAIWPENPEAAEALGPEEAAGLIREGARLAVKYAEKEAKREGAREALSEAERRIAALLAEHRTLHPDSHPMRAARGAYLDSLDAICSLIESEVKQ